MVKIIDTSLLIDRLERGDKKIEKQHIGLSKFLEELRKEFEYFGRSLGATLNISYNRQAIKEKGDSQMEIYVEETLFQSALINLLRNAAEAAPSDKKTISLSVSWEDSIVSFSVHNYGEVPAEIRDHLFQKYATAGKKQGNGLGLYTAKKIVTNAFQGDIKYVPREGETTFVVEIPV
jgi:signal transduction histidine kinase